MIESQHITIQRDTLHEIHYLLKDVQEQGKFFNNDYLNATTYVNSIPIESVDSLIVKVRNLLGLDASDAVGCQESAKDA